MVQVGLRRLQATLEESLKPDRAEMGRDGAFRRASAFLDGLPIKVGGTEVHRKQCTPSHQSVSWICGKVPLAGSGHLEDGGLLMLLVMLDLGLRGGRLRLLPLLAR